MRRLTLLFLAISSLVSAQSKYEKDFNEFWTDIRDNHAYLQQQDIRWQKVRELYAPKLAAVQNNADFVSFLESVLHELYNGHVSLNTNLRSSNRLIPSGADLFVERKNGKFIISDLRKGYGADACGLKRGMEVIRFNGTAVGPQLEKFLPRAAPEITEAMYQYAISTLFAGTHDRQRVITVIEDGKEREYFPDTFPRPAIGPLLEFRRLSGKTGYIRINNSLGDNSLIPAFDAALDSLLSTRTLILDLTETPGGGNTTVARSIMGRFISKRLPYQQHEFDEVPFGTRRYWVEYVLPRGRTYTGKLLVLVGRWTGSMGEGMAIGFDGMKRGSVIGTPMAGLIGAISNFRMGETGIGFQIPTERLYHVNGTPREKFVPGILTANGQETWETALKQQ